MSEVLAPQLLEDDEIEADMPVSTFSFIECFADTW
jgi:hypothetical protein